VTPELLAFVRAELATPTPAPIRAFAAQLAQDIGAEAVLFYGSILRTGDLTGVLDYYVLTARPPAGRLEPWLWPRVGYRQAELGGETLRAKIAVMSLPTFRRAAAGQTLDTTVWARFVQPAAIVHAASPAAEAEVVQAIAAAAETAARYAALLGPARGLAEDYWAALFRSTYRAEFRVEPPGRERQILAYDKARYDALLPLAWASGGVRFSQTGADLAPQLSNGERRRLRAAWRRRALAGKPLNIARLTKAAFTFEGETRYAAWKIERHTGVQIPITPFRERYPILAAPAAALALWRARRRRG
jgi:hypothetical protein